MFFRYSRVSISVWVSSPPFRWRIKALAGTLFINEGCSFLTIHRKKTSSKGALCLPHTSVFGWAFVSVHIFKSKLDLLNIPIGLFLFAETLIMNWVIIYATSSHTMLAELIVLSHFFLDCLELALLLKLNIVNLSFANLLRSLKSICIYYLFLIFA